MSRSPAHSERLRRRWQKNREAMLPVSLVNAAKGTAALTGTHFTLDRSRRASEALTGRKMGGAFAAGVDHVFADQYALCGPDGHIYRGRNIIDFVRSNPELFDPADLAWKRGHCRASKGLSKLRPTVIGTKPSWKGWTWQS